MAILTLYEIYVHFLGEPLKSPYIDSFNPDERIRVNLNISFHECPCAGLSVDY